MTTQTLNGDLNPMISSPVLTPTSQSILLCKNVSVHYGSLLAVQDVSLKIPKNQITAFIGPSGCGKSTLIRCFNRLNDLIPDTHVAGEITLDGMNIYDRSVDLVSLRRRVGMVFQKPVVD